MTVAAPPVRAAEEAFTVGRPSPEFLGDRQQLLRRRSVTHKSHIEIERRHQTQGSPHRGVDPTAAIAEGAAAEQCQKNDIRYAALRVQHGPDAQPFAQDIDLVCRQVPRCRAMASSPV
jgi:hypothetical protein